MPLTAFISKRVVFDDGMRPACVVVDQDSGKIVEIANAPPANAQIIECGEDALLPGLVDSHVHLNEPGRTDWEGFVTGTQAAAAGGITTVIDMPLNCLPETTTVAALEAKRLSAAGKCFVDWRPWGGAVNGNEAHLLDLAQAGVPGYKCFLIYPGCDGFGLIDEQELRAAMPLIAQTGLPLLVHAELAGPCETAAAILVDADWHTYSTYLLSRPDEAELQAITLMISLAREFDAWVHIVHLSSALALPLLRAAKAEGLKLTVETCPHYLSFAAEDIANSQILHKCAPPIRSRANSELLWDALRDGTIDLIASDHSPCPPEMKTDSFRTSWGGIASLSLGLPILWSRAHARGYTLNDVVRWMATGPARLAGLADRKGRIAVGYDADLVFFAPEETFTVTESHLHFRHKISPYLGQTLQGIVKKTYVRGQLVFSEGGFAQDPVGIELASTIAPQLLASRDMAAQ